jgi:hypothetical protein
VHGRQQELIDLELLKMGGWLAAEMTPHLSAPGVNMPVLMIQVLRDSWTRNPEDAQNESVKKSGIGECRRLEGCLLRSRRALNSGGKCGHAVSKKRPNQGIHSVKHRPEPVN